MPTIRVEYEVPDNDCEKCRYLCGFVGNNKNMCSAFHFHHLKKGDNGKYNRCQPCIDATVKEGE
jgi:hypothetical protein